MEPQDEEEIHNCLIKLRSNPERRRDKVYIGCGAGFGGDKPLAALKLLQRVQELNYLVLECLAERTLADRYQIMMSGGDGYDSQISNWMHMLLPLALERGTCIITNMGAIPFMELLLPVFLKLFPNMLPSTFQDKMKEQEALKRRLNARIEYAKFLQDTIKEMAKEIHNSQSGEMKKTAKDLDEFMNKVRTGARVSNDEILGFAKLFNDELTLDNISKLVLLPLLMFNKLCSPVINLIFWGSAIVLTCLFGYENGKHASLGVRFIYSFSLSVNSGSSLDYDGKVTPEEVVSVAMYLKDTLGKEGIHELISNLSKDSEVAMEAAKAAITGGILVVLQQLVKEHPTMALEVNPPKVYESGEHIIVIAFSQFIEF
ncbi:hypothetical protein JHK86_027411 [Glycine max]|nr:hypothetical protein JHK86_027411 [Glycine max]